MCKLLPEGRIYASRKLWTWAASNCQSIFYVSSSLCSYLNLLGRVGSGQRGWRVGSGRAKSGSAQHWSNSDLGALLRYLCAKSYQSKSYTSEGDLFRQDYWQVCTLYVSKEIFESMLVNTFVTRSSFTNPQVVTQVHIIISILNFANHHKCHDICLRISFWTFFHLFCQLDTLFLQGTSLS